MPTISDYNSIPMSDGIKEIFGRDNACRDVNPADPSKMLVSVNGKTFSIQELVTQAEAFQYLLKAPSKLEFFANTAHVNFLHYAPCGPLPKLTNDTLLGMAKIHNIERGTPEYTLLYIMQEYFEAQKKEKDFTVLFGDTVAALAKAIGDADVYDEDHRDLKDFAQGYGVLLSVNEANALMQLLLHLSPVKPPTP